MYTGKALRDIANNEALSPDATLIVDGDSGVDTSLLTKYAEGNQFVVEQRSNAKKFHLNLLRVRQRLFSSKLSVFDFTPTSNEAIRDFNVAGTVGEWRGSSQKIERIFARLDQRKALQPRTVEALRSRLLDPEGGVVVIYGHSDGDSIWLDTDDGISRLTPEDIKEIGETARGRLPAILLLNCHAESLLAPAFLDAGSPFVAATDKPMTLTEATKFLDSYAKRVFRDSQDVIDAFYNSADALPFRMRPMANSVKGLSEGEKHLLVDFARVVSADIRLWVSIVEDDS